MAYAHRAWEVSETSLRLAGRIIDRREIVDSRATCIEERDTAGAKLIFVAFMLVTAIVVIGVFELGWRTRYLLAAGLCGAIALTGLQDMRQASLVRTFDVEIHLRSGETVSVTLAEEREARALVAALGC
jgi:uncharacterized ion transporter superfamily protein YfcC